ncbi:hypothetical protein CLOM_g22207 [Closterium sp. NIES-68]|nr:hypothetical protein CLOM_g22207 [Closterium sp. NIES-68]
MFEHIKDLVEADDSGPRAWKLLRDVIQPNTLPMVIVLEKELAAISMRPGDDVKPVLDKIKDTYARIAAAGSSVSQLQQCTKIISVLDNSWDNLIPTLNSQQDQWIPSHMTPRTDLLDEVKPPGKIKYVAAASGALLPVIGVGNAKRLQKSKAEVTFGPTSRRAKLGKKVLWSLEEETSCIKDLTTGPAKTRLALVHMDVVGPTRAPSLSGSRYVLTIVDDHTRAVWVYPLKSKGEVAAAVLKEWMPRAQRECGHKWYGSAPAVNMLRAFGCMVVFHVPKEKRGKLEASGRWEQMLEMQFKCSKMGEGKYYLGMHVERDVEKGA